MKKIDVFFKWKTSRIRNECFRLALTSVFQSNGSTAIRIIQFYSVACKFRNQILFHLFFGKKVIGNTVNSKQINQP